MADTTDHHTSRIVEAVAEAEGVDPVALDPPLGTVVDSDALGTLLADTTSDAEVRFTYRGHDVAVDQSGRVRVN